MNAGLGFAKKLKCARGALLYGVGEWCAIDDPENRGERAMMFVRVWMVVRKIVLV